MELKIFSPTDDAQVSTIAWNYDELKSELAAKLEDYKGLVYTDSQIIEAKKDKAALNKLRAAIETKRKEVKARCLAPYAAFEAQIKEIVGMIDEPIALIDSQIKDYDAKEAERKKEDIKATFDASGFGDYVTLDKVWNPRWLNKSYSLKQIKQDLHDIQTRIDEETHTINSSLPDEYRDVAIQYYAKTLDLSASLAKAAEVRRINEEAERRRKEREAEKAREEVAKLEEANKKFLQEETSRAVQRLTELEEAQTPDEDAKPAHEPPQEAAQADKPVKRMRVVFAVTAEQPEFGYLNHLFSELREHASFEILSKEDI